MGKVDDMRAWNEWREYHRALKRDKAVDKLSPVERMRRLEKLCLLYTSPSPRD